MHASLRLDGIARLPDPVKTLAMSAAKGSLEDLAQLQDLIPDSPNAQLRLFIPACFANLKTTAIPDLRRQLHTDISVVQNRVATVVLALETLCILQEHLVARAYAEVWSSAWTWMQFLDEWEHHESGEETPSPAELHMVYLTTITSLGRDPETFSTIKNTPRVRVFIAKAWGAAVDQLDPEDDPFRELCEFLIKHAEPKNPCNLNEFIEGAGSINDLAVLAVKHIRLAVPDRNHTVGNHDGFALLAVYSFLGDAELFRGPLRLPLVAHGLVGAVSAALCALCGPEMLMTEQIIPLSIGTLVPHITASPGFPWVKEAFDAGFLRAIVLCASRPMFALITIPLGVFFRQLLVDSLVYHSVLSTLRAALDDAREAAESPGFRRSSYAGAWDEFVALATERLAIMDQYDSGEFGAQRACDNIDCGAIRKDDALLRCTACRNAFYCSKECQAADWTDGHRKLCKSALNRPQDECPQLTFRDRDFFRVLVHHDYEASRPNILAFQIPYLQHSPNAQCLIKFNYGKGRVAIEAGPVPAEIADQADRAARSGGRVELHMMAVKEGGGAARTHLVPMRYEDGRVLDQMKAIVAGRRPVTTEVLRGVLDLEVTRTH
ncbi:hypothetical protein DFH06DRAFT_1193819 [Mycena polygramma]|nr:hypothetical protein DFH06DRAFT_1193819 [Mycena polygramma]